MTAPAPTVWILEDEPRAASILRDLIQLSIPAVIASTLNSSDQLAKAMSWRGAPDLLISDYLMSDAYHADAVEAVLDFAKANPTIPIIIHTAWPKEANERLGGVARDVVEKGDPARLLSRVTSALSARGFPQSLQVVEGEGGVLVQRAAQPWGSMWIAAGLSAAASVARLNLVYGCGAGSRRRFWSR